MTPLQELRNEVGRVGRLIDAGQRGVPMGGELLIAFGTVFALLVSFAAFEAFRYWPIGWIPSPLAGAAAFVSLAVVVRGDTWPRGGIATMALAALAGEVVWQIGLQMLMATRESDPPTAAFMGMAFFIVPTALIGLGAAVALWRLRRSAAAASPANRSALGTWLGLAVGMNVTVAVVVIVGARTGNWSGMSFLPCLFWILWGAGWAASSAATGSRWMLAVAAGAWALALVSAAYFNVFFTSIAGFVGLAILPGVQLMREARRTHEA